MPTRRKSKVSTAVRRRKQSQLPAALQSQPGVALPESESDSDRGDEPPDDEGIESVAHLQRVANTSDQRRLDTILRALPAQELSALVERMGIRVDDKKRIDVPAQVARALVRLPDVREPSRLAPVSAELLRRVAEANGALVVSALPAGLETLVRRGILFARMVEDGIELILPTAFLVQLKSWEGEDPRSLRALLAEAPFETASAIASHYLERPSTPPIALSLEPAWEVLGDPKALRDELERVAHQERRLLDAIEQIGSEVDTQELMDLEREPMRVRGAYGVAAGRRGAAFSLEKRGLLFPLHPNRYVIPTEVVAIIGAERRREREARRNRIREHVFEEDHLPRRAKFSVEPAPLALALTLAQADSGQEVKPGVGTPRSLVARLAQRFGHDVEATALMIALSRAIGLWEAGVSAASPPGSLKLWELSGALFNTWRRGGAWDEARPDSEMLRVAQEHRDPSPVGLLREMVLDALSDLGEGQWVPYAALQDYLEADPHIRGLERLLSRWSRRVGLDTPTPEEITQRIVIESLPTLGVVDLGGADVKRSSAPPRRHGSSPRHVVELSSLALRLSNRGRRFIAGEAALARGREKSEFSEPRVLRLGCGATVTQVLGLGGFSDIAAVDSAIELSLEQSGIARGLATGIQASEMRDRVAAIAPLSDELRRAFEQAGTVVGKGTFTLSGGFVWIDDRDVRELLATTPSTRDLFLDPSPAGGLLVGPGTDPERLVRRCRALGVELDLEESVLRARNSSMPPPAKSDTRKSVSWRPPATKPRKRGTGND